MPFPVIPSFVTIGLFRLGYKFAENKKWLPDYVYHNLSVNKLKDGDLEQALYFNRIAIDKNPKSEKAQIMRDIINMRKDVSLTSLENRIKNELENISDLKEHIRQIQKDVRVYKIRKRSLLVFQILCTLLYIAGMFIWAQFDRSVFFYSVLILGIVVLSGMLLYQRYFSPGAGISETILQQERLISLKTKNEEMEYRQKRLSGYEKELDKVIKEFI